MGEKRKALPRMDNKEGSGNVKLFKWQTEEKFLANMMLLSNSLFLLVSGYFFIADGFRTQAVTYLYMADLMPLEAWGVFMILSGFFVGAAAFQVGYLRCLSMIAGGLMGGAIVGLYAMAATQGAEQYLSPIRYAVTACFNFLIAALGGVEAWRIKKKVSLRTLN